MSNNHKKDLPIKYIVMVLATIAIAIFAWSFIKTQRAKNKPVDIVIQNTDHAIGNANSKVKIVEYADFQCPYCAAYDKVLAEFLPQYQDKVFYVFRHFPLLNMHQNTLVAAIGAEAAAKQGKFWEYKKVVFENQKDWEGSLDAEGKIKSYLPAIGVDTAKWETDMKDESLRKIVMDSYQEAMSMGLSGTPTIIINGVKVDLQKVASLEDLKKYVDAELAK